MSDDYTRAVLHRAQQLCEGERALTALDMSRSGVWRAWLAAALAALMALYPSVGTALLL